MLRTIRLGLSVTLLAFLGGCGTGRFQTLSELRAQFDLPDFPDASRYPDADALLLVNSVDVEIYQAGSDQHHYERTIHRVLRVFRNAESLRTMEIAFEAGDQVVTAEARCFDPSGAVRRIQSHAITVDRLSEEDAGAGAAPATAPGVVVVDFGNVAPGATLEARVTLRRPAAYLFDQWTVQETFPILYNQYTLTFPRGLRRPDGTDWDWRYRLYRCANVGKPQILERRNPALGLTLTYLWAVRNVAPFVAEPHMPAALSRLEFARIAPADWTEWKAFTEWYRSTHFDPALANAATVPAVVAEICTGLTQPRPRLDALRRFVQALGELNRPMNRGFLTPLTPDETLTRQAGGSLDKATLLVAMLQEAGFKARPALTVSRRGGDFDERFPSWGFDRMLVVTEIEGEGVWIDPAARWRPLGKLPWYDQGRRAVALAADGAAEILTTPITSAPENAWQRTMQAGFDPEGRTRLVYETVRRGEPAAEWRERMAAIEGIPEEKLEAICRAEAEIDYPGAELTLWRLEQPDGDEQDLKIRIEFTTDRLIVPGTPWPSLSVPFPDDLSVYQLAEESRRFPLQLDYPRRIVRRFSIDLEGSSYRMQFLPSDAELHNHDLTFRTRYSSSSATHLSGEHSLEVRTPVLLPRNHEIARQVHLAMESARGPAFGLRTGR